jgi:hypothetical protein
MTAYFDNLLRDAADVENRVISIVQLVTGDREFPGDLREQILGHIAVLRIDSGNLPPTRGRARANACRDSPLLETLHDDFHALARRRIVTRFGLMLDSPENILRLRDEWDGSNCSQRQRRPRRG